MVKANDEQADRMARMQENIRRNLEPIGRKIAVMSGKGGVGKTTVAVNLARELAAAGRKVGIIDVDIHGPDVPLVLGIEDKKVFSDGKRMMPCRVSDNLSAISMAFMLSGRDSPVIWRGPMKIQVINQFLGEVDWGPLDYLIIDLPPGTGDESLSIAQMIPGAEALIVTTPQDVALLDSRKAVNFARSLNMPVLGILENMSGFSCPKCGTNIDLFKKGGGEKAAGEMVVPFLGRLPISPEVVQSSDEGLSPAAGRQESEYMNEFMSIIKKIEEVK